MPRQGIQDADAGGTSDERLRQTEGNDMTNDSGRREAAFDRQAEDAGAQGSPRGSPKAFNQRGRGIWIGAIAFVLLLAVLALTGYIEKWLWMRQLDYVGIFWTVLSVKVGIGVLAFLLVFGFLWVNLREAVRGGAPETSARSRWGAALVAANDRDNETVAELFPIVLKAAFVLVSAGVAFLYALALSSRWDTWLRFRYGKPFGSADPLYGVDVGFYVFHLPFYVMLQRGLLVLTVLTLGIVCLNHVLTGAVSLMRRTNPTLGPRASAHISALLALLAAMLCWGFYLGIFELLYSNVGVVYGAGYTVANVTRWALWGMVGLSAIACAFCLVNAFRQRFQGQTLALGAGVYAAAWALGVYLVPGLFQTFIVQPNELAMETPYLKYYIDSTRNAFQLGSIVETSYPALSDLTPEVMARNEDTIQNIRLWDARPLLQTFSQTQAIRLYYQFYDVATDRYHLADGYHQVMLSTRELSNELPAGAQTWVNQYLQFTHGNGLVMNFVSKTAGSGVPEYLLENVPAESNFGLNISQPAIYYGQSMSGYRIVDTAIKEFDYPKGNDNVYASYAGTGGIPLDNGWKRLLFAWNKSDINILMTQYLKPESRIQIHRDVRERISEVAPFLRLDSDPYPVLSDGKLYWIQDAYTGSSYFPYSNPQSTEQFASKQVDSSFGPNSLGSRFSDHVEAAMAPQPQSGLEGLNYIRNSVKVVVDMFNGDVKFYIMDAADPVLGVYRQAFPGVFKPLDELSADLKAHLRYPEDIFAVQANQYKTFHMKDPQVFYNREDLWDAPTETYAGEMQRMEPYYILAKLPGSAQLEYMLMTPFTPHHRDNMISWMAARSDFPDYGKMLFYELPKDKLIYGPNQIEAMINQNTTISQQLTLWNQNGSRVIRGKQIVTPIENSFLYVVPLYLTSAATDFPQLKRVIAITGDRVVMEPTLDQAIAALFGPHRPKTLGSGPQVAPTAAAPTVVGAAGSDLGQVGQERAQLGDAQQAYGKGDWTKFGDAMDKLKILLNQPTPVSRN
jgi:uncharacterized membrane protein (UPF0182 family)